MTFPAVLPCEGDEGTLQLQRNANFLNIQKQYALLLLAICLVKIKKVFVKVINDSSVNATGKKNEVEAVKD